MNIRGDNTRGRAPGRRPAGLPALLLAVLLIGVGCLVPVTGCAQQAFLENLPPMLPANYYKCIESTTLQVQGSYFDPYGHRWVAEMTYNDQPFVFKDIEVFPSMIESRGPDYLWVDRIRCKAVNPDDVAKLKVGQIIDVVGIMRGISKDPDLQLNLEMTECYFLPAGAVALPLPGGAAFVPGY